jgi:hypothetical protein
MLAVLHDPPFYTRLEEESTTECAPAQVRECIYTISTCFYQKATLYRLILHTNTRIALAPANSTIQNMAWNAFRLQSYAHSPSKDVVIS